MELPTYFILSSTRAYTSSTRPTTITFESKIKLRYHRKTPITILATHPLAAPHLFSTSIPEANIPVYKSTLQKLVRRRLTEQAIRVAYAFLATDTPGFLRRLPIIMLEDVLPLPSIISLTWWMMAVTKGYILSDEEVSYILGIVYTLCQIDSYQAFNKYCKYIDPLPDFTSLPSIPRDVLWSLEIRKSYNGMKCDTYMIDYLQRSWFRRFSEKGTSHPLWKYILAHEVYPVDLDTLGTCDKYDLISEGIDYHCYRWLLKKLHTAFPYIEEYQIQGAIWFYRSRINVRKTCEGSEPVRHPGPELKKVYDEIEDTLERWCEWIFDKLI